MKVEVARNKELYAQSFSRGIPQGPIDKVGPAPNRRGTSVTFHPDAEIFGILAFQTRAAAEDGALQGLSVFGRRNPLEIRDH